MRYLLAVLLGVLAIVLGQCSSLPYESDSGFLNSAQANSSEWMVRVDGLVCKDLDGLVGACSKRVKSKTDIKVHHDPRPYSYRVAMRCTEGTGIDFSIDVLENQPWGYTIRHDKFKGFRSFTCQGEVFPNDRDNAISALWQIRFLVVDQDYKKRESVYFSNDQLVMGKHARYTTICDPTCDDESEGTVVKTTPTASAYSESEVMRFNYYNVK